MARRTATPLPKSAAVPRREVDPLFRTTLVVVLAVTLLRLMWLASAPIDLYPDEAQYWIWSRELAWGYFSKPPLIAWVIAFTTALFGDTDLAVKMAAPLFYAATSMVVYATASRLYDRRVGCGAAIAFVTLPAVAVSSVIISTDIPLLFFWALALYGFVRAREPGAPLRWWALVGVAGGLGLLSKYEMGFWLGSAALFLLSVKDERRHLKPFLAALVLALAIYSPNLVWNVLHGFVSYKHTQANASLSGSLFHPRSFLEFAGSQFGVFGPVFLGGLILILARARSTLADRRALMLAMFAVPTLAIMLCVSFLSRAQANWSAPAYASATILVVAWLVAQRRETWVQWSVVAHVFIVIILFGLKDFAAVLHVPLPGEYDPLHRLRGWSTLGRSVAELRLRHPGLTLMCDDRETMAALIYYMRPHPSGMIKWNRSSRIGDGFDMTQRIQDVPGQNFFYVTSSADAGGAFPYFESHREIARITVPLGPDLARQVEVYELNGFKGFGAASPRPSEGPPAPGDSATERPAGVP
jgi:hypothetical protein